MLRKVKDIRRDIGARREDCTLGNVKGEVIESRHVHEV